jgi:CheY-like chemotaxis protein
MVVDDNPDNVRLLESMLQKQGYEVRPFTRGQMALAASASKPPDLILLDVSMPEMTGIEMCERLKADKELSGIPVLFISAMNQIYDKVEGFRAGGVDYISKPFQFEEVSARVETHLKLRQARRAEQELLERTLNGSIRMLWDLVLTASPELATRSRAIRDCVAWITKQMNIADPWQYDLAAMLCLTGCLTLPEETFKRGYRGETVSAEEEAMFRAHPESAARLLKNIPRLEPIAEMIRQQLRPDSDPAASDGIRLGACFLSLAVELDRRIYRGIPVVAALRQLQDIPDRFDPTMLRAIGAYRPSTPEFYSRALPIRQLCAGMALEEDAVSGSGMIILRKDTVLTDTWIERLGNFAKFQGVKQPLQVRIPIAAGMPAFRGGPSLSDSRGR